MHAAVVRSLEHPPRYEAFAEPHATTEHEALRDVETVWTRPERPGSRVVLVP